MLHNVCSLVDLTSYDFDLGCCAPSHKHRSIATVRCCSSTLLLLQSYSLLAHHKLRVAIAYHPRGLGGAPFFRWLDFIALAS